MKSLTVLAIGGNSLIRDKNHIGLSSQYEAVQKTSKYISELIAAGASGDLAYTVAYEHNTVSVDGAPRTYTLRVTQVYRREDGEWKLAHRHGDELTPDQKRLPSMLA